MNYYKVSKALAEQLGLTTFRVGDEGHGFLVTPGDLAPIGVDTAVEKHGAVAMDEAEAIKLYNVINKDNE